jgi:anti-sigma B factor antagonist
MKLHQSRQQHIDIFHLEDEIDLHYAPSLRAVFQAKVSQRCPALVVDLSGVRFIDSTGIAVLLEYLRDASGFGGKFCLAAPTDHVRHVFEIVRLHEAVPVFESTADAIAAVSNDDLPAPTQPLFSVTPSTASEYLPASRAA